MVCIEFTTETFVAFVAGGLRQPKARGRRHFRFTRPQNFYPKGVPAMPGNIFYIIGVIVVVLFILGYLGLR